jgi:proteasome accessory factor C
MARHGQVRPDLPAAQRAERTPHRHDRRRADGEARVLEGDAAPDHQCAARRAQRAYRVRRECRRVSLCCRGGGLLEEYLAPLTRRLEKLTRDQRLNLGEAGTRLRFPAIASRPAGVCFNAVCAATLQRKKIWIEYHARSTNERTERTLSPQRVVHYRETWYLDAWDDSRDALRSFSIDRIRRATPLDEPALDVPEAQLDDHFTTSYGIFGGKADKVAVLRFTAERARWVADERWHPEQDGRWIEDGSYELHVPYNDSRELLMDILKHGSGVVVTNPPALIESVRAELSRMHSAYECA